MPALPPGRVVVVDNVGADKPERMRELAAAAGCELIFLPAYFPELFRGAAIKTQGAGGRART